MERRDWLLLLVSFKGAPAGLDPIRLQKGMFLHAMESGRPADELYDFEAYNYGPMSKAVYRDLDALRLVGLVERIPVPGQTWSRYKATPSGIAHARQKVDAAGPEERSAAQGLFEVKQTIADKSFNSLLEDVYDRYPSYAERSVFRRSS